MLNIKYNLIKFFFMTEILLTLFHLTSMDMILLNSISMMNNLTWFLLKYIGIYIMTLL